LKRVLLNSVGSLILAAVLVYAGDYLSLRYQIPNRPQYGSVMVTREWAIPQKDRKTEFDFDPPAPQTCVNSWFPHFGDPPCWYLSRHPMQKVDVGGATPSF
jgi:hypothetical protein